MFEAQQCEEVTCATIDETRLKKPTLDVRPLPECTKAPDYVNPPMEWQKSQVADFSDIRLYIAQIRNEIIEGKRSRRVSNIKLPHASNKNGWIDTCINTAENASYIEPTLTTILELSQPTIEQVLEYLVEFLEDQRFIEPQLGRWLYALLAALELPLHPDVCSCLRSLARLCSNKRSQLDFSQANEALSLNLFICLVARYFRQLDLADQ
ncbi:gem-associated protein 2 isoform X2 [Phymastichus coffea]|nr:gem-associated protein 2 isoform X2 [Phymastichus coffea]